MNYSGNSDENGKDKWMELQEQYFRDRPIIVAANRAPVTFEKTPEGELIYQRGAGGLVSALIGLTKQIPVTWIGCARSPDDVIFHAGDVSFDREHSVHIQFLNPEADVYEAYYNVIANPLLWFLQHSMWDLPRVPIIDRHTWQAWESGYRVVNRMFADAIVQHARKALKPPLVMLQDYHLYLAGRMIREQLHGDRAPILLHFIHIPWPGPEYWRILPPTMRQPILESLCAMDVLGFQTKDDGLNFLRTVESFLPRASVKYKRGRIWYRNHATFVHDFPISIDMHSLRELAASQEVADYHQQYAELNGENALIVRIDRTEPSKNILRGFLAFGELMELHPEYLGKVNFLALLIPSRIQVSEYQDYLEELMAAAGRINARLGESEWEPIRIIVSENLPRAVAVMQLYDVLLVNSIADGMNLVAKEGPIVNQRDGVLILSERTGARQQLAPGALVISPCDIYATAQAMHQALSMSKEDRKENIERLRWLIERDDLESWLYAQLLAVINTGCLK